MDWSKAKVLFIQNPAAEKIANGHNYSCTPIAKLILNLHLGPVHDMTDDQFMNIGIARYAKGLEQVEEGARDLSYKAVVLDTRNCDQRVLNLVRKMKVPTLITDDINKITENQLAEFLTNASVYVDQRTPTSLQLFTGPKHVVIYNHTAILVSATAYPQVKQNSPFKLINNAQQTLFTGTNVQLQSKGIKITVAPRTAMILAITE